MNNKLRTIIFVLGLFLALVVYLDYSKPKPVDWRVSFELKDQIPFGLYVFDQEFEKRSPKTEVNKINTTLYEFLEPHSNFESEDLEYEIDGTIISISDDYNLDDSSTKALLHFVAVGNTAFLSCKSFSEKLRDTLHFNEQPTFNVSDSCKYWVANKKLGQQKFGLNAASNASSFTKIDSATTAVLGYQGNDAKKDVNFVKIKYEKGFFYLHTQPFAFVNYNLLAKNNFEYAEKIISYLPKAPVFWLVKSQNGEVISSSPLRFIMKQPALKWAWFIFIFGMATFLVFNAKRKQRVVPITTPLSNTTVEFAKTIGNLYLQEGDHQTIINKKIIYFLEKTRADYLLDTSILNEKFIERYHNKSGKNLDDIANAVRLIKFHQKQVHQSIADDLIDLNKAIEKIT